MNVQLLFHANVIILLAIFVLDVPTCILAQENQFFELPVQLIGFPLIIASVRLTNFVKKLSYALNPNTYMQRSRREIAAGEDAMIDMQDAEKRLTAEFGEHVCIYPKVCLHHAAQARKSQGSSPDNHQLDWNNILSHYKASPDKNKEFYLLSVFLGDILASPRFCHLLGKRRHCSD